MRAEHWNKNEYTKNHELVNDGGGQANVRGSRRTRQPESDRRPHGSYPGRLLSARGASVFRRESRCNNIMLSSVFLFLDIFGGPRASSIAAPGGRGPFHRRVRSSFLRAFLNVPLLPPTSFSCLLLLHNIENSDPLGRRRHPAVSRRSSQRRHHPTPPGRGE